MNQPKDSAHTLLLLAEQSQRQPIRPDDVQQPHVGIWWHSGLQAAVILQPVSALPESMLLVDSTLAHYQEWPLVARHFGLPRTADAYVLPRGRTLYDRRQKQGLIYHGNGTNRRILRKLARLFGVARWQAKLDEHYLIGEAADRLFEDN